MRFVHGLLTLAVACSGGSGDGGGDPDGGGRPDGNPELATIFPPVVHTGYDGAHQFRVPVSTDLSNQVEGEAAWSSDDPSIVAIESVDTPPEYPATRGVWAMITPLPRARPSALMTSGFGIDCANF